MRTRIGHGFDIHRLVEGRDLRLGGISVPFSQGLLGHSDGDAVLHAVCDALLGAVGAGDIGRHFPDTDPQYRDADSADLLSRVAALVRERGYTLGNLDVTVMAERPRLASHLDAMRSRIAAVLGAREDRINVKAKTMEGLDAVGRGEAIAAAAVALLESTT